MKNIIITLIALALCIEARAEDRTLTTTDGVTYSGITYQRVKPDGLYIEYSLPGGGIGMSKVKFTRLSRAQQKQYGYDRADARDYEAAQMQANDDAAQDLIHRYEVERDTRHQRDVENERAYQFRMNEIARVNAEQAAAFYRTTAAETVKNNGISYGTQFTAGSPSTQTSYGAAAADLFPNRGISFRGH